MNAEMIPYWLVQLAIWIAVVIFAAAGAFTAAFRKKEKVRFGDPMRLSCLLVASLFIGHSLRWLYAPTWMAAWKALLLTSALAGLHVIRLMYVYGRGALLTDVEARRLREMSDG